MADYYPLITRAVAGLEKSTGEGRRALYERARNALVEQLRSVTPALSETDITRERLALEEAIRKVEAEAVRQMRAEPAPVVPDDPLPPPPADLDAEAAPPLEPETVPPLPHADPGSEPVTADDLPPLPEAMPAETPAPSRPPVAPRRWHTRMQPAAASPPPPETGIKGFDDIVADAENLGQATAEAGRAARESYSSVPSPSPEFDRLEPRLDSAARRPPPLRSRSSGLERRNAPPQGFEGADPLPGDRTYPPPPPASRSISSPPIPDNLRQVVERARGSEERSFGRKLMGGMVKLGIAALVLLLLAGTLYWQRNNLLAMMRSTVTAVRGPVPTTPPRETAQQRPKITDRIAQPDAPGQQGEAAAALRSVLYEDDPVEPSGRQFIGSVTWRTENTPPAAGQPPDMAIRGEVTIPERNMRVTIVIRRNTDPGLTASHTVSIMFDLPPDFPNEGISEIRGMLMKQSEDTRGTSLAGLAVKVTPTFFLVGLSSASDADVQRNLQLLKERSWFDVAIVYANGRRAILAVEKGGAGDRAFTEAFAAWGQ